MAHCQGLRREDLDTSFWNRRSYVPSGADVVLRRHGTHLT